MAKATMHMREAPLTHEIVVVAQELPLEHPDPADRFLAATAEVLGLTLVTADRRLLGLGKIATLANRWVQSILGNKGSKTSFGEIVQLAKARRVDTVKGLGPPLNSWTGSN
jgi:hypothetical protein